MPRITTLIPLLLMVLVGVGLAIGLGNDPRELPSTMIDKPLPDFELPSLREGEPPLRRADLLGKVSLINVFGSWCGACQVEHPHLMQLAADKRIPIYGVDWKDTTEAGRAWIAALGDPYTKIGEDRDSTLAINLGVTGAPETFVIDRTGNVRYRHVGALTADIWHKVVEPLVLELEAETGP